MYLNKKFDPRIHWVTKKAWIKAAETEHESLHAVCGALIYDEKGWAALFVGQHTPVKDKKVTCEICAQYPDYGMSLLQGMGELQG